MSRRKQRLIVILVLLIVILGSLFIGCEKKEYEGIITNKYIKPGYYYTTMMMVNKIMIPVTHYMPASNTLVVKCDDGKERTITVKTETYNKYNIGDRIKFTK